MVELPFLLWWPILNGPVLLSRPPRSARAYSRIWLPEGSPLMVHSQRLASGIQECLESESPGRYQVRLAMRYGQPSIPDAMEAFRSSGCRKILAVPLYPQYAAATTASTFDAITRVVGKWRDVPELRFVHDWHSHPLYIGAIARSIRSFWQKEGEPDRLLVSFHGLPKRSSALGDPYEAQCGETARLLSQSLGLSDGQWLQTFQSRFGPAKWLGPATDRTLESLGRSGLRLVDCVCPGFAADCLETLEEIAIAGRELFLRAGGGSMRYIPALNSDPEWVRDFTEIIGHHCRSW